MQIGRYQVLETIGAGAQSQVFRAHDPMIGRTVCLKLFPADLAAGDARQHFLQEARIVGKISHPAVVMLHDMGIDDLSSTPYLVMEYVEGLPLNRVLEKGSIPVPKACSWAADVAAALGVAHRNGVIHGDIKPANILITADGRVKLTDFGMARVANHDSMDTPLLGTPAYWCPEQIIGKPQDARSDIFSLGVVFYEMVTGRKLFEAQSMQDICSRILSSTPLSASQVNSAVPKSLSNLIASCVAKDPAARRQSAAELAAELYPFARRSTVTAVPQPVTSSFSDKVVRLLRSA